MKCCVRAWGYLKRVFEVLALDEMCFEGMGELIRGFEVLALGGKHLQGIGAVAKGNSRCWHWMNSVLRAWGELQRVLFLTNSVGDCFVIQDWLPNGCQ